MGIIRFFGGKITTFFSAKKEAFTHTAWCAALYNELKPINIMLGPVHKSLAHSCN